MMKTNLAVFFGGRSVEHDVSIVTGLQALENVDTAKHNAFPVYLARDGRWYTGDALRNVDAYKAFDAGAKGVVSVQLSPVPGQGLVIMEEKGGLFGGNRQIILPVDVALLCMHGVHGEDGSLQGLLEMSDIPYTSAAVGASATGLDKALMKKVFIGCGFPTPAYTDFTREGYTADKDGILRHIDAEIGYPLYVKPANLGSSIGITCVTQKQMLSDAIVLALSYDRRVVVEKAVSNAMEINCSVLGYGADCRASLLEKPVGWQEFLTFDDKYLRQGKGKGGTGRLIPAPIPEEMTEQIQTLAKGVFAAMDCKGVVRIDFLIDEKKQEIFVNEINTIPGSMAFYLWEPTGIKYPALIDELVTIALRAKADKKKNSYAYDSSILDKVKAGRGVKGAKGSKHG
jgi:D-alanine-D-alanine ligase